MRCSIRVDVLASRNESPLGLLTDQDLRDLLAMTSSISLHGQVVVRNSVVSATIEFPDVNKTSRNKLRGRHFVLVIAVPVVKIWGSQPPPSHFVSQPPYLVWYIRPAPVEPRADNQSILHIPDILTPVHDS